MTIQEIIKNIESYRDSFGLIAQKDGDGGDTLNKTSFYYSCLAVLNYQEEAWLERDLNIITKGLPEGRYRRHPDLTRWYSNPDNVTRDQMAPTEAALVLYNNTPKLFKHLLKRLIFRLSFHFSTQNGGLDEGPIVHKFPDIISPQELGVILRSTPWLFIPLYPLLNLLDLALIYDSTQPLGQGQPVINCAVAKKCPTVFSKLATYLLKKRSTGNDEITAYWTATVGVKPMTDLVIMAKEAL